MTDKRPPPPLPADVSMRKIFGDAHMPPEFEEHVRLGCAMYGTEFTPELARAMWIETKARADRRRRRRAAQ